MSHSAQTPARFLVDPFELRKAGTVILTAVAMIEASHSARAGRPIAFLFGQATLSPIVADLINLAAACGHTAANYESCENSLTPKFIKEFQAVEPKLVKAAAEVALAFDGAIGGGETAVEVRPVLTDQTSAAVTLDSLLLRLKHAGSLQELLIDVTQTESGRQFVLYLPGTKNWHLLPGTEAFDLTSDLAAMASPGIAAPERAALQTMQSLGFGRKPGDHAVIAGYSEGGLIGANLIQSGALTALGGSVVGLIAVGSPISSSSLPASVSVISLEHSNDPVPKLDLAEHRPTANWVTAKLPASGFLGHSLDGYLKSLTQLGTRQQASLEQRLSSMLLPQTAAAQTAEVGFRVTRVGG